MHFRNYVFIFSVFKTFNFILIKRFETIYLFFLLVRKTIKYLKKNKKVIMKL